MTKPIVTAFFDEPTNTVTYIVADPDTKSCAIVDSVLDYDASSGETTTQSADELIAHIQQHDLKLEYILETHAHADHFSAAPFLQEQLGGIIGIGKHIDDVQKVFGRLFNAGSDFKADGSEFGRLFGDGDCFKIGSLEADVIHVPGHTPACVAFHIGDTVFVGDTLFMPDFGSARCDFPGGDAGTLFDSVQKLYALPDETRMFVCHDYKAPGRDEYAWETTVGEQKRSNKHLNSSVTRDEFIKMRTERDQTLSLPKLIMPSIQVNMRAGRLPPPEDNGVSYIKIPLNVKMG
jgi:glyoxylase-like metal-dependent hydrolase (beta-lactamase superfamily II)